MSRLREDLGPLRRRSAVLFAAVLLTLSALSLRLVQLQLVHCDYWRMMSENNRVRRLPVPSSRGRIYDRRGRVLADNRATWDLLVFPDEARDLNRTALFLARAGLADAATMLERLTERGSVPLAPVVAGEGLSWSQVARVRTHQSDFPELSVMAGFRRTYPLAELTAHTVGYLRPVRQDELDANPELSPSALVGATGIEEQRDRFLSGRGGERWMIANAVGQQLGVVREQPASPGNDLTTTLDLELQLTAARALEDAAGAVVALNPSSGAVRVMVSAPSFDPNVFTGRLSTEMWATLRDDPRHPLHNRCIQGAYPPGSTIKPFLALEGLEQGLITPDWSVSCPGSIVLHGHPFRCWRRHGRVSLTKSLEESCDVFYYLLGQKLGIEGIAGGLERFAFGQRTGIGLANERPGLIGTPQWSEEVRHQPWYPGETVSVSIGQGPVLTTTLQLARAFAALANGGRLVTPRLVEDPTAPPPRPLHLDGAHLARVVEGLRRVVQGPRGTAWVLADLPAAGKTGTAQVARLQEGVSLDELPHHLRHHAWFVGWAPVDAPEIVVAVLVEHGGGGGSVAAPVAGRVLRAALDAR